MSRIITVGREFGSGGRELGKRLADELGITVNRVQQIASRATRNVMRFIRYGR